MGITKKTISTAIMVLDQSFGTINFVSNSNNIANVELRSHIIKTISELNKKNIKCIVFVNQSLLDNHTSEGIKQFLPDIQDVILFKELGNALSSYLQQANLKAEESVFVSSDRSLRGIAADMGVITLPHPSIALLYSTDPSLHFVRMIGERKLVHSLQNIIPYYIKHMEGDKVMLLAIMTDNVIAKAISNRITVDILPLDLYTDDPMFVSVDRVNERTHEKLKDQKIIFFDGNKLLVALSPSKANDSVPFHDMHGHYNFLAPDPTLFKPVTKPFNLLRKSEINLARWPKDKVKITRIDQEPSRFGLISDITTTPITTTTPIDPDSIKRTVEKYSGISDIDSRGKIKSRHCEHADNSRITEAIEDEMRSMGYDPYTHSFSYRSTILINVIADMPGIGQFKAEPDLPAQVRSIFLKHPSLYPSESWIVAIKELLGEDWMKEQNLDKLSPLDLKKELENIFLRDSSWWTKGQSLNGLGSQIIIVCCHLDSTANFESGFDPTNDPAPGADDNGSGLAGVLSIAKYLSQFRGKLIHTIRFCFFNAEEEGLLGSKEYASYLKDKDVSIKAVINLDMMGYNGDRLKSFEIHAGYYNPTIRDQCVIIAEIIKQWSENIGKLGPAQIYKGTKQGGPRDYDRNEFDGAIERSDHYAFQQYGYPACHLSEDFFSNFPTEAMEDPNPNYHRYADNFVDYEFTSDIVSVAALAIKELASK